MFVTFWYIWAHDVTLQDILKHASCSGQSQDIEEMNFYKQLGGGEAVGSTWIDHFCFVYHIVL